MNDDDCYIVVGQYTIGPFRGNNEDFWIENKDGEGMQVFVRNFEKLIDEYFKSEF